MYTDHVQDPDTRRQLKMMMMIEKMIMAKWVLVQESH
jgi:hypothetical protein